MRLGHSLCLLLQEDEWLNGGMSKVPFNGSSSCHLREIFLSVTASLVLVRDLNVHQDFCKAALGMMT